MRAVQRYDRDLCKCKALVHPLARDDHADLATQLSALFSCEIVNCSARQQTTERGSWWGWATLTWRINNSGLEHSIPDTISLSLVPSTTSIAHGYGFNKARPSSLSARVAS